MKNNNLINKLLPHLYFITIPLFIFRDLLGRGYILVLDMVFAPNMSFESLNGYGTYSEIIRDWVLHQSAQIVPADIIQKFILFLIFYLSGILMYKLLKKLKLSNTAAIIGATFYIFNPFVYTRLIAGHWAFLLGYALLPCFYGLLLKAFSKSLRNCKPAVIKVALIWILASIISVHHYALFAIVFILFISNKLILTEKQERKKIFKKSLIIFILASIVSLAWIPVSISNGSTVPFSIEQLHFFAPTPDSQFGTVFNLLAFYGFWAENTIGSMPKDTMSIWYIIFFILSAIASVAFLKRIHSNVIKHKVKISHNYLTLLPIALIGIILSLGSFGILRYIWVVFYEYIPLLQPFRDTQKFLSLYVFVFSVGLGYGISNLQNIKLRPPNPLKGTYKGSFIKRFRGLFVTIITLTLIFTYTHSLGNLNNELSLTDYPDSWYQLEKIVNKDDKILVLPWEPYSFYSFVDNGKGKQIANPAPSFFNANVISNTQLSEFTDSNCHITLTNNHNELCLNLDDNADIWSNQLRTFQVDYVLVNKISNYEKYSVIDEMDDAEVVFEDEFGVVYKISD